ncbi:hypothetical protein BDY21DRAFT_329748 [Lineolata rhizophorae]|uniref:Uncharacterized protein n=1 Tax=Lineolata rhizophorae TaxID=578093 RepID=A0A6A6PEJ5_9PEZI|nr:hypothetical protein BDY21DRAFT_329748 [Lineolata rhizophorae]
MKGISSLPVHLNNISFEGNYLLGRIVINSLVLLFPAVYACLKWNRSLSVARLPLYTKSITYGTNSFTLWYILHVIDLSLRKAQIKTTYRYVLTDSLFYVFKFAADIFIIAGAYRIASAEISKRILKSWIWKATGDFVIILLTMLALFHVGTRFAHGILWIGVADIIDIQHLAQRRNEFEIAFMVLQFLLALGTLAMSTLSLWLWKAIDGWRIPKESWLLVVATGSLLIRSMSELVVVARHNYRLMPKNPDTEFARDFVYGLFSSIFLVVITVFAQYMRTKSPKQNLVERMKQDCRQYVLARLDDSSDPRTGRSAIAVLTVLDELRQDWRGRMSTDIMEAMGSTPQVEQELRRQYMDYIAKLQSEYGQLVPVTVG